MMALDTRLSLILLGMVLLLVSLTSACQPSSVDTIPTASPPPTSVPTTATAPAPTTTSSPTPVFSPLVASPTPLAAPSADFLEHIDWASVMETDGDLERERLPAADGTLTGDLWVRDRNHQEGGLPVLDQILYGDLDGDGLEEAVISLHSGGTAGIVNFLVYRATTSEPRLVLSRPGYKSAARIEASQLVITDSIYAGWEPNCCPSSVAATHYRLRGDSLVVVTTAYVPNPQSEIQTVDYFYELLQQQEYERAYSFLSPSFQAESPYASWVAGFARTVDIVAQATRLPNGSVDVDLTVTDRTADGRLETSEFRGRWWLVYSPERKQWLLDNAQIIKVP